MDRKDITDLKEVPDIVIPTALQKALAISPEEPFDSDFAYFEWLEASSLARELVSEMKKKCHESFFKMGQTNSFSVFGNPSSLVLKNGGQLVQLFEALTDDLEKKLETRLTITTEKDLMTPRLERLMEKLDATPLQKRVFRFCFASRIRHEGNKPSYYRGQTMHPFTPSYVGEMFQMPPPDFVQMFGGNWVKENLSRTINGIHEDFYFVSQQMSACLMGAKLSYEKFQSLESPLLRQLISEEPSFEGSTAGQLRASMEGSSSVPSAPDPLSFLQQNKGLFDIIKQEREREQKEIKAKESDEIEKIEEEKQFGEEHETGQEEEEEEEKTKKYESNIQYLQDQFLLLSLIQKMRRLNRAKEKQLLEDDDDHDDFSDPFAYRAPPWAEEGPTKESKDVKLANSLRKAQTKYASLKAKIEHRLVLTAKKGDWVPRFERLALALNLEEFEKWIVLHLVKRGITGTDPSPPADSYASESMGRVLTNHLLQTYSNNMEDMVEYRKYFYKSATLVKEGVLIMNGVDFYDAVKPESTGLRSATTEIDKRMMDFVVGLDTEFSEIVDGSNLYRPNVSFDDVVLPSDVKETVFEAISNYTKVQIAIEQLGMGQTVSYGKGLCILFHGPSGTGKTMLANAIATKLEKKILLINYPSLGSFGAGAVLKLIFRESKIHDVVLFFDECEGMFLSREKGGSGVGSVLTELERHDGLSILATNRASDLDEAMYRRINLAVEFKKPDYIFREKIWRTLHPPKLKLDDDVNLSELAHKFELSGGLIKNVWLMALSFAVSRDGENFVIRQSDLKKAAGHQLKGRLRMVDFDRRVVPTRGLEDLVVSEDLKRNLVQMVEYTKAESILFGQWGFHKQHGGTKGMGALFCGPPGCGKTMAAEAIGYDLGRPLKVVNCGELVSKYVGETGKNIEAVFEEARAVDAVLVFDEAEGLLASRGGEWSSGSTGRHDAINVGLLLHHIETFPGISICITNLKDKVDKAFFRRFKFVLMFDLPDSGMRAKIFRNLVPTDCPVDGDIDFEELGRRYALSGGGIKSAVFRAATTAALRVKASERVVRMSDLEKACQDELSKDDESSKRIEQMYT